MRHNDKPQATSDEFDRGRRGLLLYLMYALGIMVVLSLYYVVKHRAFAFVDIGIDSFNVYYAFQVLHARQLHELHTMTWSFAAGLGSYTGWMSNALIWLNALFPASWQLGLRLPTYMLRLLLAGGFLFGYLRRLNFEPFIAAAGALAYAFCGYAMINGQWDTQGYFVPQLAAYLFLLESYFRRRKAGYAVAAGVVACSGAVFDTYTFTLISVLYVAVRPLLVSKQDDAAPYLPSLCRYIGWAAVGAMLTAVVLVPNLIYLLSNPRVSGSHSIVNELLGRAFDLNNHKILIAEGAGLFGKGMLGTGSGFSAYTNWFEAPGFYVGILMLVCIPQLLGPRATWRERGMWAAGLALFLAYLLWPFMRFAVYGFAHRGFRISTMYVSFGLLILGVAGLRRAYRSGTWRTGLVGATTAIILVALYVAFRVPEHVRFGHVAMVMAFALTYTVLLWPRHDGMPRIPVTALVTVLACELLLFAIPPIMHRTTVASNGSSRIGSYHDGTGKALARVRKLDDSGEFYRIEKTYRSIYLNDALVQNYSGTKSDFFHGKSITRFVDKLHLPRPHPRTAYIGSMVGRANVIDLLGVKYLLARNRKLDAKPHMAYVGKAGKINIYRNTDAHGVAHLYTDVTGETAVDKLSQAHIDALLLKKVIVDDPQTIRRQLHTLNQRAASPAAQAPKVSLVKVSDIHLDADVAAPRAGVLLITMPFTSGWTATIDGMDAALFRADYGLTALLIPPGRHQIKLHYAVPGRLLGIWLSLAALVILLAIGVYKLSRRVSRRSALRSTQR